MPQAVGVDAPQPRREVEQLHAHGKHDPRDGKAGPGGPYAPGLAVAVDAEPAPEGVLEDAGGDVGGHVVGVVPADDLEVPHVHEVQQDAQEGPGAEDGAAARGGAVEAEDADRGVVHAVEDGGTGGEVVELLGEAEVAGVEDGAEDPGGHADAREGDVEGPQGVGPRDVGADLAQAAPVRPEVAQGEEHAEGLLHAQEAVERPLSMELDDFPAGGDAAGGDDVLAGVVALAGAVPEEQAVVDRWRGGGESAR